MTLTGSITLGVILSISIYLWILDVLGISRWTAETIGEYIGMVITAAGGK